MYYFEETYMSVGMGELFWLIWTAVNCAEGLRLQNQVMEEEEEEEEGEEREEEEEEDGLMHVENHGYAGEGGGE